MSTSGKYNRVVKKGMLVMLVLAGGMSSMPVMWETLLYATFPSTF